MFDGKGVRLYGLCRSESTLCTAIVCDGLCDDVFSYIRVRMIYIRVSLSEINENQAKMIIILIRCS